jgi:hemerythrin
MEPPGWHAGLSVGDHYIDAQHAILLYLIAQLEEALDADDHDRLLNVLDELKKYATFHFASEENHMAAVDYPGRHEHARMHTRMLVELSDHIRRVEDDAKAGYAALGFVERWLNDHIGQEDQKYAQYARQGGRWRNT